MQQCFQSHPGARAHFLLGMTVVTGFIHPEEMAVGGPHSHLPTLWVIYWEGKAKFTTDEHCMRTWQNGLNWDGGGSD